MSSLHPAQLFVLALASLVLIRWNLWRAVLFLAPGSVLVDSDAPAGAAPLPAPLSGPHRALLALGFVALGTHLEHPRFGKRLLSFDYAHPTERVYASLFLGLSGPRLYLLTPTRGGGLVLTADFRRPAREEKGRYLSGTVEGATPERLLRAHQRRVAELGEPDSSWTLDGRVDAARSWYSGAGKTEVRQQNAVGLLWTVFAIGMVGAALWTGFHRESS